MDFEYYQWLLPPANLNDLKQLASKGLFPVVEGLLPALVYAFIFGVARVALTYLIFKPLAILATNTQDTNFRPKSVIDTAMCKFIKSKHIAKADLEKLVLATKLPISEITDYVHAKSQEKARKLKITKFIEALWRCLFYTYFSYLGFEILIYPVLAPWILDTKLHFVNWPLQEIPESIVYLHNIELGCYIHQLMWTEVTRSDSIEMIIHHLTTITLVLISHLTKFQRIGSLTFFLHDISDIFLESAKCFNYISKVKGRDWASRVSEILFGIFAISFGTLRLFFYPKLVVYSMVVESQRILGLWPGYYLISTLMCTLVCLHIFWFYLICKMVYKLILSGTVEKDERSDDEEDTIIGDVDGDDNDDTTTKFHPKTD